MWIFYFAALPHIAFDVAAAAYYTPPIFITLLAAIFLREKITISGWLAIVIGFIGTLLILQPQADDFDAYALYCHWFRHCVMPAGNQGRKAPS
jgi:drug/metabolite transporter (DMT)-like permease